MLLSRDRKRTITDKIAALIREGFDEGQPSKFWCEGSARYGVRSSLCLQGWPWTPADAVAAEIVTAALDKVGARRPPWLEGQPEYTQPGALPIGRDSCVNCRKPLPEGHWKFCSKECGDAYHHRQAAERTREEQNAARRARMAAWSAKQPDRPCGWCGRDYRPKRPNQRYCCPRCSGLAVGHAYGGEH
jgi:hypothetical protein